MIPGSQPETVAVTVAALIAVLALVALAHHAARRGWIRLPMRTAPGGDRLAIVQSLPLDARRRLHLVACDGRHVIVLTGGPQDLVIGWLPERAA